MSDFKVVKLVDPIQFTNVSGGLVPRGAYVASTDYAVGDSVDYNGSSYVMFNNAIAGVLPTDTTYWQVLASKGNPGTVGTSGQGVPIGGTTGQVLSKIDATNYNTQWVTSGGGTSDHTLLTNIGTNTHAQIDTAVSNSASHIANTSNPHSVTKTQVGLGNVDNTSDVDKPVSTAQQTALDDKPSKTTANTFTTGMKQTVSHDATNAGFSLGNVTGNPASAVEGDVWYNSSSDTILYRAGASARTLVNTDAAQSLTNKTIAGASNTVTGLVATTALSATGTKDATTFLRGDDTWATPAGGGGGAATSLNNLAAVAINTSLVSDTTLTNDLGSSSVYWNNVYAKRQYLNSTAYIDGATAGAATFALNNAAGLTLSNGNNTTYTTMMNANAVSMPANGYATMRIGQYPSDSNAVEMNYQYKGAGLYTNNFFFGLHSNTTIMGFDGYGQVTLAKSSRFNVASGTQKAVSITPTYNHSGTSAATDLFINRTQTSLGSGAQLLADFQVGGVSKFKVDNTGTPTIAPLAGTGTRMVTADASGVLSSQAIPAGGGSGITRSVVNTSATAYAIGSTLAVDYVYFITGAHNSTMVAATSNTNVYTFINIHTAAVQLARFGTDTFFTDVAGVTTLDIAPGESIDLISNGTSVWKVT